MPENNEQFKKQLENIILNESSRKNSTNFYYLKEFCPAVKTNAKNIVLMTVDKECHIFVNCTARCDDMGGGATNVKFYQPINPLFTPNNEPVLKKILSFDYVTCNIVVGVSTNQEQNIDMEKYYNLLVNKSSFSSGKSRWKAKTSDENTISRMDLYSLIGCNFLAISQDRISPINIDLKFITKEFNVSYSKGEKSGNNKTFNESDYIVAFSFLFLQECLGLVKNNENYINDFINSNNLESSDFDKKYKLFKTLFEKIIDTYTNDDFETEPTLSDLSLEERYHLFISKTINFDPVKVVSKKESFRHHNNMSQYKKDYCQICQLNESGLLEHAHICDEALIKNSTLKNIDKAYLNREKENYLTLCCNHHKAFDKKMFDIVDNAGHIVWNVADSILTGEGSFDKIHEFTDSNYKFLELKKELESKDNH